jgi:hypothetical protein
MEKNFDAIRSYGSVIEQRLDDSGLSMEELIRENEENLQLCRKHDNPYILVEDVYDIPLEKIWK